MDLIRSVAQYFPKDNRTKVVLYLLEFNMYFIDILDLLYRERFTIISNIIFEYIQKSIKSTYQSHIKAHNQ